MLQDFVYGYGVDLKDLKLTDNFYKSDQWFDFGDGKAAFSEYIDGYPANDPAIKIQRSLPRLHQRHDPGQLPGPRTQNTCLLRRT